MFRRPFLLILMVSFTLPTSALRAQTSGTQTIQDPFITEMQQLLSGKAIGSCPFTNPLYSDLFQSAAALSKKIDLPPQCEETSEKLFQSGSHVNSLVTELQALKEKLKGKAPSDPLAPASPLAEEDSKKSAQLVTDIVSSISGMAQTYDNSTRQDGKCGRALLAKRDFLAAIMSSATHVSGLVAQFGGPAGAVASMGVNILSSGFNAIATLLRSRDFQMEKHENRRIFTESLCAFYRFDQSLRALQRLDMDSVNTDQLNHRLMEKRAELLKSEPQPVLPAAFVQTFAGAQASDRKSLRDLKEKYDAFSDYPALQCEIFKSVTLAKPGQTAISDSITYRLDSLLNETELNPAIDTRILRTISSHFNAFSNNPAQMTCANFSTWYGLASQVMDLIDHELKRPGRLDLSCLSSFKARNHWETKMERLNQALAQVKERTNFIAKLIDEGADNELSDLTAIADQMSGTLFGESHSGIVSGMMGGKSSAAHAWLEYKVFQFERALSKMNVIGPDVLYAVTYTGPTRTERFEEKNATPKQIEYHNRIKSQSCQIVGKGVYSMAAMASHFGAVNTFCKAFNKILIGGKFQRVNRFCGYERQNELTQKLLSVSETYGFDDTTLNAWLAANPRCGSELVKTSPDEVEDPNSRADPNPKTSISETDEVTIDRSQWVGRCLTK
ncbi:MAG: hypothetical protein JNL01_03085 [Bdellovibrionales bacterium]|nr:hypothetical protein [Bdellovibrionales bacterium]